MSWWSFLLLNTSFLLVCLKNSQPLNDKVKLWENNFFICQSLRLVEECLIFQHLWLAIKCHSSEARMWLNFFLLFNNRNSQLVSVRVRNCQNWDRFCTHRRRRARDKTSWELCLLEGGENRQCQRRINVIVSGAIYTCKFLRAWFGCGRVTYHFCKEWASATSKCQKS